MTYLIILFCAIALRAMHCNYLARKHGYTVEGYSE